VSELPRRAVHASTSVVPLAWLLGAPWTYVQGFLVLACVVVAAAEALRLAGVIDHWRLFSNLTREYEQENPAGYALGAVAMTVVALAFDPFLAVPAMFMLTLGDPISGLLSSDDLGVKQSWVMLATFGVCLAIASVLRVPLPAAIAGAVAATVADGVKPVVFTYVVDDNFSIPVASASAMWAVINLV